MRIVVVMQVRLLLLVLILIILEVTLWDFNFRIKDEGGNCLNPYYTGSYSMSDIMYAASRVRDGLNPYYTGSYSMRKPAAAFGTRKASS